MPKTTLNANITYGDNGDRDLTLTVWYDYYPKYFGRGETPDEDEHVSVYRVLTEASDKSNIDVTHLFNLEVLEAEVLASHLGEIEEAKEAAYEARKEERS